MKILIAIPCLLNGGTERQTLMLSEVLQSCSHAVWILCYFEYDPAIVNELEKTGASVKLLNLDRKSGFLRIICRLRKEIRSARPEIVHVQYMAPGALPIVAARLAGVKKIFATVHQPYTKSHGMFAKLILRIASLLIIKFIAVSQNAERSWFGSAAMFNESRPLRLQPHHFTIQNAIDIDEIQKIISSTDREGLKKELDIHDGAIIIGAVSRLRHEKGIDTLVNAFSMLTQSHKNVHLLVVGNGPDEEALQNQAKESGISFMVTFYGQASWEHAMELLSLMDIVVVPSRFEGFGLTAAEAMAAGKPVIASDTSGLKEVVNDNETGILFPVDDVIALTDAMSKLVSVPQLRSNLGMAGKERVNTFFSTDIFRKNILSLYRNLS